MTPEDADLFVSLNRLRQFCRDHPDTIVRRPSETFSGLWELSLPGTVCMAFDSVERMTEVLDRLEDRLG